jgi:glucokinase
LGVAVLARQAAGDTVFPTEGGHIGFAPTDAFDLALLHRLQQRYGRVSVERVVSGPGLAHIYETLADLRGEQMGTLDDAALWEAALSGEDRLAQEALERFLLILGGVAGDLCLAHLSKALVLTGSLANRMAARLRSSGFTQRFCAKGRYANLMETIPIFLCRHPEPGLLGAAAAFAAL